jgi:UDPglucose--hexose-1-phosphate uridylyltransferase
MDESSIRSVVDAWTEQYVELGKLSYINHVQIFENKGELMGCSNPHPHCQVWAQESIPAEPAKEISRMDDHRHRNKSCLLCDYIAAEFVEKERIVYENRHFVVLVPFWAVWPFETMILPKRHLGSLADLTEEEKDSYADAVKTMTVRYDNIFSASFPYSSGIHQSPTDKTEHLEFHMHMHFYPPLLRSASIKKFMVGYEMLAEPQRDILPENAAENLRAVSGRHYKKG